VHVLPLLPSPPALTRLEAHFLLVYTGQTRLARTLLQDVRRRWFAADPAFTAAVAELQENAAAMEQAVMAGDVAACGACLDKYWTQKKTVCEAEPASVARLVTVLRPAVLGACLCGAGGGGFLLLVTRRPDAEGEVSRLLGTLRGLKGEEQPTVHRVAFYSEDLLVLREGCES
jgi:fucokinase